MVDPNAMTEPVMSSCAGQFTLRCSRVTTYDILGDTSKSEDQARSDGDKEDSCDLLISSHRTLQNEA